MARREVSWCVGTLVFIPRSEIREEIAVCMERTSEVGALERYYGDPRRQLTGVGTDRGRKAVFSFRHRSEDSW